MLGAPAIFHIYLVRGREIHCVVRRSRQLNRYLSLAILPACVDRHFLLTACARMSLTNPALHDSLKEPPRTHSLPQRDCRSHRRQFSRFLLPAHPRPARAAIFHYDVLAHFRARPIGNRRLAVHPSPRTTSVLHIHVPACRLAAYPREHVVPLALWRECRRPSRPRAISRLLSSVRTGRRHRPNAFQSRFSCSVPGSERRHRGSSWRLCDFLPFLANPYTHHAFLLVVLRAIARCAFHRIVVSGSVFERRYFARKRRIRRRSVVGPRRRVSAGDASRFRN